MKKLRNTLLSIKPSYVAMTLAMAGLSVAALALAVNTQNKDAARADMPDLAASYSPDTPYYQQVAVHPLTLQGDYRIARHYSGVVKAKQHAQISFESAGKVSSVLVDIGDRVKKGQKLAQLDTTTLNIEKRQLQAKVQEVDAQLELVKSSQQRQHALKDDGYSSQQKLDELLAQQKSYQASLQHLQASIDLLNSHIRRASLRAPFDGSITARFVDSGHVINAAQDILRIQQRGQMEANIGIPVQLTQKLIAGNNYPVLINNQRYSAKLIGIGSDVQPQTRSVILRLLLPTEAQVFNGELAELALQETVNQSGYWLPATAVTDGIRGLWSGYVVKKNSQGPAILEKRDVTIHHANAQQYFVSGAISSGEEIVSNGLQRLVPGQKVRLQQLLHAGGSYQL